MAEFEKQQSDNTAITSQRGIDLLKVDQWVQTDMARLQSIYGKQWSYQQLKKFEQADQKRQSFQFKPDNRTDSQRQYQQDKSARMAEAKQNLDAYNKSGVKSVLEYTPFGGFALAHEAELNEELGNTDYAQSLRTQALARTPFDLLGTIYGASYPVSTLASSVGSYTGGKIGHHYGGETGKIIGDIAGGGIGTGLPKFVTTLSQRFTSNDFQAGNYAYSVDGNTLSVGPQLKSKKLSVEERLGIPKHYRKTKSSYINLGEMTFTRENRSVDNPRFGKFIGNGSEQTVFEDLFNNDKVLKVYDSGRYFRSIDEIKEWHPSWFKRNQIPMQLPVKFEGYVTHRYGISPVYSQQKINPIGKMTFAQYRKLIHPKLQYQMKSLGFSGDGDNTPFKYNNLFLNDVSTNNMGYDNLGNLWFFDVDVFKTGGRIRMRT